MKQISIIFQKMKCWLRQFLFTAKNHYKTVVIDFLIYTLACDPWTLIVTNPAGYSKIL